MDKRPGSPSGAGFPVGKKQRSESRKVGIVCQSRTDGPDVGDYEIKIYVVDLDRQSSKRCEAAVTEYPDVDPVVKLFFPKSYGTFAVCILNGTVYIFEGSNCRVPSPISQQTSARKFVLSEEVLSSTNHVLMGEDLERISPMHHRKGYPEAIPTPDGKYILVFGNEFYLSESSGEFELYDPLENGWIKLPGLPYSCMGDKTVEVKGYSFVGKSHFVMLTNDLSFALNLDKREWIYVDHPPFRLCGYFVTAKGRYGITGAGDGSDIGNGQFLKGEEWERVKHFDDFPLSTFPPNNFPDLMFPSCMFPPPSILPLDPIVQGEGEAQVGDVCHTCILRLQDDYLADEDYVLGKAEARLLIDVCHTDLSTFKTVVSKYVSLRIQYLDNISRLNLITL